MHGLRGGFTVRVIGEEEEKEEEEGEVREEGERVAKLVVKPAPQ